jgi:thiosulfate/3-mercaptopyruvate sulfurtransferase
MNRHQERDMPDETATLSEFRTRGYAHPEVLVSTAWVNDHLDDPRVRVVESDEDPLLYPWGHLPGAVTVDWAMDLNDPVCRDYLQRREFEVLMARLGIANDTTVVLYGDKNNWWACYAFWVFRLFAHKDVRVMDGGRHKWELERRPLTRELPLARSATYRAPERDDTRIRAFREQVLSHVAYGQPLVDVRSPQEYSGERTHMPEYPQEGVLRGGHVPGARNVPWANAVHVEDGTFKSGDALRALYEGGQGLSPGDDVITYCRIGERSSHTWFVLHYLLGFPRVRNYDGSWTEWGNSVGLPIERS